MQEVVVGEEWVYWGTYSCERQVGGTSVGGMRVVIGYRDEESVCEGWDVTLPGGFTWLEEGEGDWSPDHGDRWEMTIRAVAGEKGPSAHRFRYRRRASVTEVLLARPIPTSGPARPRIPAYVGPVVQLANRLWQAEGAARRGALHAAVWPWTDLIRLVEEHRAPYASSRPLRNLLGRIRALPEAGPDVDVGLDRAWVQALVILGWLASPGCEPAPHAVAVEARCATRGHAEEALAWIAGEADRALTAMIAGLAGDGTTNRKPEESELEEYELERPDRAKRRRCAVALGWTRRGADEAVKALTGALRDESHHLRGTAAAALARLGPAATAAARPLIEALLDQRSGVRSAAFRALWQIRPPAAAAVPGLCEVLRRPDPIPFDAYEAVASLLVRFGPEAAAAIPTLRAALLGHERGFAALARALGWIDVEAAVATLVEALQIDDWRCRYEVAAALYRLGPAARAAVPVLLQALGHDVRDARDCVARALWSIDPDAAFTAFFRWLRDPDSATRLRGAEALGEVAPSVAESAPAPALAEGLGDPDLEVREEAATGLGRVGPAAAVMTALCVALDDTDPKVRERATWALGQLWRGAVAAVPALIARLGDDSPAVRAVAATSLGEIGPGAAAAVPGLIARIGDEDRDVRARALDALGAIGPGAAAAVPALIAALVDEAVGDPAVVATSLGAIGPGAVAAVPALADALRHRCAETRREAARALKQIVPGAAAAVPAVAEALGDVEKEMRHAVEDALARLRDEF